MNEAARTRTGGCLCGALRYELSGAPQYMGHCYCEDCRKASGSGFMPFMGYPAESVRFIGQSRTFSSKAANGNDAVRNYCPICCSLVFGGVVGESTDFTIYAGSLDDPSRFQPSMAIFTRTRPAWALLPPDLKIFEGAPG